MKLVGSFLRAVFGYATPDNTRLEKTILKLNSVADAMEKDSREFREQAVDDLANSR